MPELNQLLIKLCRGEVLQNCLEGKAESNNNLFTISESIEFPNFLEIIYLLLFNF